MFPKERGMEVLYCGWQVQGNIEVGDKFKERLKKLFKSVWWRAFWEMQKWKLEIKTFRRNCFAKSPSPASGIPLSLAFKTHFFYHRHHHHLLSENAHSHFFLFLCFFYGTFVHFKHFSTTNLSSFSLRGKLSNLTYSYHLTMYIFVSSLQSS